MKRIFNAVALVLFSGGLLLASGQSSGSGPSIRSNGTLLGLPSAEGRSSLDALEQDGFSLSYKWFTKLKSKQKTKTVWAIGADSAGLGTGEVRVDGNSASVIVTTEDGALEITSSFTLDEQNQLIIRRTLKNNSAKPLSLKMTEHFDAKLMGTSGSTQLRSRALQHVKGKGCNETALVDRPPHDFCMPGSVCPPNWAVLSTNEDRVSLKWNCTKTVDPGTKAHFDVWVDLQNAHQ